MIFITSDLHYGHKAVIDYCNRPYKDVDEMNLAITENWNKKVSKNDIIYVLGDFSLSPKYVEEFLPKLNGEKHLILGNHDAPFDGKLGTKPNKTKRLLERYYKAGFKSIQYNLWITLSKRRNGILGKLGLKKKYKVQLCHFPFVPDGVNNLDTRYLNKRVKNIGQYLLAGHSHCYYLKNYNMIDVGFDHKFEPWSEKELIDIIEDKRDYIPSRVTQFYKDRKEDLIKKDY